MDSRKEQGVVLLVSIIMLLLITIIGVTAMNSSGIKNQIAGNSMFSMLVYQGAESALAKSASNSDIDNIRNSIAYYPSSMDVPNIADEHITSGAVLKSKANITFVGNVVGCPVTSAAISTGVSGYNCQMFKVDAESRIQSTNAVDTHLKGIAIISP